MINPKWIAILTMAGLVLGSNILVEIPINDWLTWGALLYPLTFFVTELVNRFYGPKEARQVVYSGFLAAIFLCFGIANRRIAVASVTAFLVGQLLDISVFNLLRRGSWWLAPVAASLLATALDTVLFFVVAFAGTDFPWITNALGDGAVKFSLDLILLLPFRMVLRIQSGDLPKSVRLA